MGWFEETFRKVHMDFHTPEFPSCALKKFDAGKWVSMLKKSNINGGVFFTKDHYGNSYYDTAIGHKHAALSVDYFGLIRKKAQDNDIKVVAYHSVGWDWFAAEKNPDWRQKDNSGNVLNCGKWKWMCINSPYRDELLLPQLEEIARKYKPDGFWLDIVCFDKKGCYCEYCRKKYAIQYGSPMPEDPFLLLDFKTRSISDFVRQARDVIKAVNADILMTFNGAGSLEWAAPTKYADYLTIESHPFLYDMQPLDTIMKAKYAANFNKPIEICTSRFLHSWGAWDLKPQDQMKFQFSQIISHGCTINCGDQAYPDGTLEPAVYEQMGKAFAFVKEREKWCRGVQSVPYIALLCGSWDDSLHGAVQMLSEKHWHFDILTEDNLNRLGEYQALVCPDLRTLSPEIISAIREFVQKGGGLLATYQTSLDSGGKFSLQDVLGVEYSEPSPYSVCYLEVSESIKSGCPQMPLLLQGNSLKVRRGETTRELAHIINPLTETVTERHVSHQHAPPGGKSGFPAITLNQFGKGKCVYIAVPIFNAFWEKNHWYLREVFNNVLSLLVNEKIIEIDGPLSLEVVLSRQRERILLNLLYSHAERRTKGTMTVEDIPAVADVKVKLSKKVISPHKIYTIPGKNEINWTESKGAVSFTVPEFRIHTIVVLE
jgi:hypothetical protein